jgi:nicotinamidase-related amidase
MSHPRIIDPTKSALLVVDVQEAFRSVIEDFDGLASRIAIAVRGSQILDVPILVTEQYPKGLGNTAHEIRSVLPSDFEFIEKTAFSSCGAEVLETRLRASGIIHVIVCGLETHVCVNQTSHDLLDRGFQVHLLTDCVASRSEYNKQAGLSKMLSSGVIPSTIEMALFEMMRDARHEKFKEIQRLIK